MAARNRAAIAEALDRYAETLAATRHGPLARQDGITAETVRERFRTGETLARDLAHRNAEKQAAYTRASDHVVDLRAELSEIAGAGRAEIAAVQSSADPAAAKISRITEVVLTCQASANLAGGKQAANLMDSVQRVLNTAGPATSARQFASLHGVDVGASFGALSATRTAEVRRSVESTLRAAPGPAQSPSSAGGVARPGQVPRAPTGEARAEVRPHPSPGPRVGPLPSGPVAAAGIGRPTIASAPASRATAPAAAPRSHHLLAAVARQEPRLRWAIGHGGQTDPATILTTDLAGGWVPPHVGIPAGLTLLAPPPRPGDLMSILGHADTVAVYLPGEPIPPHDEIPMSLSGRHIEPIADLGQKIWHATEGTSGLPRLVHSLAWAAAGGAACDGDEVRQLGELLQTLGARIITRYPDAADPVDLARWQLVAAVAAVVDDQPRVAGYHFGWFAAR